MFIAWSCSGYACFSFSRIGNPIVESIILFYFPIFNIYIDQTLVLIVELGPYLSTRLVLPDYFSYCCFPYSLLHLRSNYVSVGASPGSLP